MNRRCLSVAALIVAVLLLPKCDVEACGPNWEPDVFVSVHAPDDRATFANGQLGILQAGFDSSDYAVAYRYLNGGKLSEAERNVYAPPATPPKYSDEWWSNATPDQRYKAGLEKLAEEKATRAAEPPNHWLAERAKYVPASEPVAQTPSFPTDWQGNVVLNDSYLNCPGPAFQNATLTLTDRAGRWGKESRWLADWIHAQDAVFSNCTSKTAATPAPGPADSPALLKADRAYQLASASFYARHFDEAAQQFAAISADHSSPWREWGTYLEARATVRKAFAMGKSTDPWSGDLASYDDATMRRAQQLLESLLAQPRPSPSREIIQNELNFIYIRTAPEKRAAEISAALAGPAPDAGFAQDLQDLNFLLMKNVKINGPAPLLDWIDAWRNGRVTAANAFATWQQTHAQAWLIIALAKAGPSDEFAPALIEDAGKVAPNTPAYDTVFYHRVRLLTALNRTEEARSLLDAALPDLRRQKPSSNLNALLGERMRLARSFSEFLEFAPRPKLTTGSISHGAEDLREQCNQRAHAVNTVAPCPEAERPVEFDNDAVQILNLKTPLPLLIEAAGSTKLPQNLRESIALVAWTRSVLLQDSQSAAALNPLLPKAIRDSAGTDVGFAANLAILHNPGLKPYLEAGVPRVASYSYFDDFRDNWWCKPWYDPSEIISPVPPSAFLSPESIALADSQYAQMQKLPSSAAAIGQRVIDYANGHPDDSRVPEALALTVRATHYACQTFDRSAGSYTNEYTPTSKAAFELLHQRYPKSPWTAKTRYYY